MTLRYSRLGFGRFHVSEDYLFMKLNHEKIMVTTPIRAAAPDCICCNSYFRALSLYLLFGISPLFDARGATFEGTCSACVLSPNTAVVE